MKTPITLLILVTLVLLTCLLFPEALSAQPSLNNNPTQNPIDGGLALLAAAGGAYAVKKLRERKE